MEYFATMYKTVVRVQETPIYLAFARLNKDSLHVKVYTDSSFADIKSSHESQVGFVVFLVDGSGRFSPLTRRSCNSPGVATSPFAAESLASIVAWDKAIHIKSVLLLLSGKEVDFYLYTDSQSTSKVLKSLTTPQERAVGVRISFLREAFALRELSAIALIRYEHNPPDALTKIGSNDALYSMLKSGYVSHPVVEWCKHKDILTPV